MTVPTRHDPPAWPDRGGVVVRSADGTVSRRWRGLQALGTGATLDAGTAAGDLAGTLTGLVIPAGCTVWGQFSAIELSSGSCLMYQ
jgi:hypothetical protein